MSAPHHAAFELQRSEKLDSLNLTLEEYVHTKTGAQHIHLSADNPENVFLVALRTVPENSTGVAHILEHTALCGSKKYPVRDPFFMMTRRSLNTFMNAFTSSDWTAYPFASVNRKDFYNLLDVYLDAVFFSRLDPLDFAQEGHRLEFAEHDNPNSPLQYKGVVYNEMKGAMSSVNSQLWQTLSKYLFPATTYHYNSGGEPSCIPDLSYDELLAFYKTHYHPSNAIFMTYGDIPAIDLQRKFEEQALNTYEKLEHSITVPDEARYMSPIRVQEHYPVPENEVLEKKSHVVMGWLLGSSTNLEETLAAHLLSGVLLNHSASPLMHALEVTDLGQAPSPLCGVDSSQKEIVFVTGLEGCDKANTDAIESLILDTLSEVAKNGVPKEELEATLHQLELQQREIGGDSYPYGLQLILSALTAATHRGDPIEQLDIDSALTKLREKITQTDFLPNLVQEYLLDNSHRVLLTLAPDAEMGERRDKAERKKLDTIYGQLSEQEKNEIVEQATALKARQEMVDDAEILPCVTIEDVPPGEDDPVHENLALAKSKTVLSTFDAGTNGLTYQQVIVELPEISEDLLPLLPLFNNCMTEVAVGDKDYLEIQRLQASISGGLNAYTTIRGTAEDVHAINAFLIVSGKCLNRNQAALTDLMYETLNNVRFDETSRIRELVAQIRASREQSVTGNGHSLAMIAAASGRCASANISHKLSGLSGIKSLKNLDNGLSENTNLDELCANLGKLHKLIVDAPKRLLLISEKEQHESQIRQFAQVFDRSALSSSPIKFSPEKINSRTQQAWLCNSQVNFCAKAFETVPMAHPDAAPLVILSHVLRNNFLHRAIREQGGAYGGGASQDNNTATFRFYSYRDPRMVETLDDFDASIEWVKNNAIEWSKVEEAILGTISSIDKPDSPSGKAKRLFHAELNGRTHEMRQNFRNRVLATKAEDLKRVANEYLNVENASTAVITNPNNRAQVEPLGLEIFEL